jgi:haloalkane dehalogenase
MVMRFNALQRFLVPTGMKRTLTPAERAAYVKPYPTPASRYPQALFPKEILDSRDFLAEVESGLARLRDKPVLLLWGDADVGFRETERLRFERIFPAAEVLILHGAKHFVQEDEPEKICEAVIGFERRHTV